MSKKAILKTTLTSIADAVRQKAGITGVLSPSQMIQAINSIPSGGELNWTNIGVDLVQASDVLTGDAVAQFLSLIPHLASAQAKPIFEDYDADMTVDGDTYDLTNISRVFAVYADEALTAIRNYTIINPPLYLDASGRYSRYYLGGSTGIAYGSKVNLTIQGGAAPASNYSTYINLGGVGTNKLNKYILNNFDFSAIKGEVRLTFDVAAEEIQLNGLDSIGTLSWYWGDVGAGSIGKITGDWKASRFSNESTATFCYVKDISNFDFTKWTSATTFNNFAWEGLPQEQCLKILDFPWVLRGGMSLKFDYCFQNNLNLTSFDMTKIVGDSANSMQYMFSGCSNLVSIGATDVTIYSRYMQNMFANCVALDVKKVVVVCSNAVNMSNMFSGCTNLVEMDITIPNASSYTYFLGLFAGCTSLKKLTLRFATTGTINVFISKDEYGPQMLYNTPALEELIITSSEGATMTIGQRSASETPFKGSLKKLDLSGILASSITINQRMLVGSTTGRNYMLQTILFPAKVMYNLNYMSYTLSCEQSDEGVGSNFVKTYAGQVEPVQTLTLRIPQAEYDKLTEDEITNFTSNGGVFTVV